LDIWNREVHGHDQIWHRQNSFRLEAWHPSESGGI
jgi:hypothetical protein